MGEKLLQGGHLARMEHICGDDFWLEPIVNSSKRSASAFILLFGGFVYGMLVLDMSAYVIVHYAKDDHNVYQHRRRAHHFVISSTTYHDAEK